MRRVNCRNLEIWKVESLPKHIYAHNSVERPGAKLRHHRLRILQRLLAGNQFQPKISVLLIDAKELRCTLPAVCANHKPMGIARIAILGELLLGGPSNRDIVVLAIAWCDGLKGYLPEYAVLICLT